MHIRQASTRLLRRTMLTSTHYPIQARYWPEAEELGLNVSLQLAVVGAVAICSNRLWLLLTLSSV